MWAFGNKNDDFVDDLKGFKRKSVIWSIAGILSTILVFIGVYFIFMTCMDHSYSCRIDFKGRPRCFSMWCDTFEVKMDEGVIVGYDRDGDVIRAEDYKKIDRIAYLEKED